MVSSDPFWGYVTKMGEGDVFYCNFCNHKFAKASSITWVKSHLSGVEGLGVKICTGVPGDVKEAAWLEIHNKNKMLKTMASSSLSLEFMQPVGTSSSHERLLVDAPNNTREDAFPTTDLVSQVTQQDRQQLCNDDLPGNSRDNSRAVETTDFLLVEAADPVENMSLEFMQPVGTSSSHERLLVDAPNNIREDAFPTTDLVSQVTQQDWQQLCNDDLPGNC